MDEWEPVTITITFTGEAVAHFHRLKQLNELSGEDVVLHALELYSTASDERLKENEIGTLSPDGTFRKLAF